MVESRFLNEERSIENRFTPNTGYRVPLLYFVRGILLELRTPGTWYWITYNPHHPLIHSVYSLLHKSRQENSVKSWCFVEVFYYQMLNGMGLGQFTIHIERNIITININARVEILFPIFDNLITLGIPFRKIKSWWVDDVHGHKIFWYEFARTTDSAQVRGI